MNQQKLHLVTGAMVSPLPRLPGGWGRMRSLCGKMVDEYAIDKKQFQRSRRRCEACLVSWGWPNSGVDGSPRNVEVIFRGEATRAEATFVAKLTAALNHCPASLSLFGWSGTLCVVRKEDSDPDAFKPLASFSGIHCDGGDPNDGGNPA